MSSFGRYIPVSLAVALGIWNGYYAFSAPLKEHHDKAENSTPSATRSDGQQASNSSENTTSKGTKLSAGQGGGAPPNR